MPIWRAFSNYSTEPAILDLNLSYMLPFEHLDLRNHSLRIEILRGLASKALAKPNAIIRGWKILQPIQLEYISEDFGFITGMTAKAPYINDPVSSLIVHRLEPGWEPFFDVRLLQSSEAPESFQPSVSIKIDSVINVPERWFAPYLIFVPETGVVSRAAYGYRLLESPEIRFVSLPEIVSSYRPRHPMRVPLTPQALSRYSWQNISLGDLSYQVRELPPMAQVALDYFLEGGVPAPWARSLELDAQLD
jgi:hypothetical protein